MRLQQRIQSEVAEFSAVSETGSTPTFRHPWLDPGSIFAATGSWPPNPVRGDDDSPYLAYEMPFQSEVARISVHSRADFPRKERLHPSDVIKGKDRIRGTTCA